MASLHKDPRGKSTFFFAAFRAADGRRVTKSTKTADRKLAFKLAMEWENAARAGRENRFVEGQVRRVMAEISEQATGVPMHFHSCRDWFAEWLAGKVGAVEGRTMLKYRQVCDAFLAHVGERANLPLAAISPADVRAFRDALGATGVSPATVNQSVRKVLAVPFEAARKLGYIPINPCHGVEALKDKAVIQKDVFTPAQVKELVDAAAGDWKGVILCAATTGLRLGDVVRLCWANIDTEHDFFHARTSKTGQIVHCPILPDMRRWLDKQPRGIGRAPLFPSLADQSGTGRNGLSEQFKRIMTAAGIAGRVLRSGEGKGRTTSSLSFHSLRHTFNTSLANAGVPQEIRQKLTGHASAAMNDRYTHLELETLRKAVAKFPAIGA